MSTLEARRLADSFGPYNVSSFLRDRKESRRMSLTLFSVLFRQGNEVIGLDIVDNTRLLEKGPILFMGNLTIKSNNKRCLSEEGEKRLLNDLARRLNRPAPIAQKEFNNINFVANVDVCGQLFGEPGGLETNGVFTMISRDKSKREQEFTVQSLHVQSYNLSRVYLSKWRAFREVNMIASQDEAVPVQNRTPRWFVIKYLDATMIDYEKNKKDPTHTPRHVHRSEVYNLLARHCHWLTEKLSKQRPAVVNTFEWKKFVAKVNERMEGLRVPNQVGQINPLDANELDELFPLDDEIMSDEEDVTNVNTPPGTDQEDAVDLDFQNTHRRVAEPINNHETTPNTQEEYLRSRLWTDPDVLAAVKESLHLQEPIFPTTSRWECPVTDCYHQVNLRDSEKFEWMDDADKRFLSSKRWGPTDGKAVDLFHAIVEHHFFEHLEMAGIKFMACLPTVTDTRGQQQYEFVQLSGPGQIKDEFIGFKFEWRKPGNHKPAFHHLHTIS